jgi:hypothetical protein
MPDPAAGDALVRNWLTANAAAAGLPGGHVAEVVRVVDTR